MTRRGLGVDLVEVARVVVGDVDACRRSTASWRGWLADADRDHVAGRGDDLVDGVVVRAWRSTARRRRRRRPRCGCLPDAHRLARRCAGLGVDALDRARGGGRRPRPRSGSSVSDDDPVRVRRRWRASRRSCGSSLSSMSGAPLPGDEPDPDRVVGRPRSCRRVPAARSGRRAGGRCAASSVTSCCARARPRARASRSRARASSTPMPTFGA